MIYKSRLSTAFLHDSGGREGIRTLDRGLAYTRFPGEPIQPLWHPSECQHYSRIKRRMAAESLNRKVDLLHATSSTIFKQKHSRLF